MRHRLIAVGLILVLSVSLAIFGQQKRPPKPETARDPVCGLMVEKNPELAANYQGTTYYFCSRADRDKFQKNPQKYAKEK
jgi:YHS domain-containing protein